MSSFSVRKQMTVSLIGLDLCGTLLLKLIPPPLRNFESSFLQSSCTFKCSFSFFFQSSLSTSEPDTENREDYGSVNFTGLHGIKVTCEKGWKQKKKHHPPVLQIYFKETTSSTISSAIEEFYWDRVGGFKAVAWCSTLTNAFTGDPSSDLCSVWLKLGSLWQ